MKTAFTLLVVAALAATAPAADPIRDALVALYTSTGGDEWTANDGWNSASNYCDWHGVSCNGAGQPESLNLRNNNLVGALPSGMQALNVSVTSLDLGQNQLQGSLPDTITSFGVLSELFVDVNHLTGHIPDDFSQLFAVKNFNASYNHLTGPLPSSMKFLRYVQYFTAAHNMLSGGLDAGIQHMGNLQALDLSFNNFTSIPSVDYLRLEGLKSCQLQDNHFPCPIPSHLAAKCQITCESV